VNYKIIALKNIVDPWANKKTITVDSSVLKTYNLQHPNEFVASNLLKGSVVERAVVAGENIDNSLLDKIKNDPKKVAVFAGFDTAGSLHIGSGLILQQLKHYKSLGCSIKLPLVDHEAISARGSSIEEAKDKAKESCIPVLHQLGFDNSEVYLRSSVPEILDYVSLFSSKIEFEDVENIYGRKVSPGEYIAILIMAADLLRLTKDYSVLAIYGIDEMPHIKFTNFLAEKCNLPKISGTFSTLIPGLGNKKMSKSLPKQNIFLDDSKEEIKNKLKNHPNTNTKIMQTVSTIFLGEKIVDIETFSEKLFKLLN